MSSRSLGEVWSKFQANFDTGGVEVWCQSLVDSWSNTLTLECVSFICRANFDQTSTLGVSRFGRSLVEAWSKCIPKLDHTSTPVSKFGRNFYQSSTPTSIFKQKIIVLFNGIRNFDQQIFIILNNKYSQFWTTNIHTILDKSYPQFWPKHIHNFDQTIFTSSVIQNHNFDQQIIRFEIWLIIIILTKSKLWLIIIILNCLIYWVA